MPMPTDISTYLAQYAHELAERILKLYPPLHSVEDPVSPLLHRLLRKPFKAQAAAVMSIVKKFRESRGGSGVRSG